MRRLNVKKWSRMGRCSLNLCVIVILRIDSIFFLCQNAHKFLERFRKGSYFLQIMEVTEDLSSGLSRIWCRYVTAERSWRVLYWGGRLQLLLLSHSWKSLHGFGPLLFPYWRSFFRQIILAGFNWRWFERSCKNGCCWAQHFLFFI